MNAGEFPGIGGGALCGREINLNLPQYPQQLSSLSTPLALQQEQLRSSFIGQPRDGVKLFFFKDLQ